MTKQEIDDMRSVDIRTVDSTHLTDIKNVKINESLPRKERILNYIKQIKNPYCFISNGIMIKLAFTDDGISFEEGMIQYLSQKIGSTKI